MGNLMEGTKVVWCDNNQGFWNWSILNEDNHFLAVCPPGGYGTEFDCLAGLFRIFFGSYDLSFMAAHSRWGELAEEAVPESYVREADEEQKLLREEAGKSLRLGVSSKRAYEGEDVQGGAPE